MYIIINSNRGSVACTSPFLDTDELKKRAPGREQRFPTDLNNTNSYISFLLIPELKMLSILKADMYIT